MNNKWFRWKISVLLCAILFFIISFLSLYKGYIRFNYPDKNKYPVIGVDVSHHQNNINWKKIAEQNISFAYIKATEGGDFKDRLFENNYRIAKEYGIDVGAYHFFTFAKSGREQFNNLYSSIKDKDLDLPPVLDLEFGGNGKLKKSKKEILAEVDTMQSLIETNIGIKPVFYLTSEFIDYFYGDDSISNPIWIRGLFREPKKVNGKEWMYWQYANRGRLDGVETYIDLNVFNGSTEKYQSFVRQCKEGIEK